MMKSKRITVTITSLLLITGCSHWTQEGHNLYPKDSSWNVGIGTNSPLVSFHNDGDFITKGPWIDVRAYSSFKDAIDDIGSDDKTLLIPDEQIISANIDVPPNVSLKFLFGGSLNISEGVAVTINGSIDAGPYRIFSGGGDILIPNVKIIANWFGFDPSQTAADNAFYMSKALNAGENAIERGGSVIEIGKRGVYECDSFTIASNFLTLQGPAHKWKVASGESKITIRI